MKVEISPIVNGLVLATVVATGGLMLNAVTGKADGEDLARVEKRVDANTRDLRDHLDKWHQEQIAQAAFRAALAEKLKLKLKPEG